MQGTTLVKLATDLAVGNITTDFIQEHYGESTLSSVLQIAGVLGAGSLTHAALDAIDKETGLVSDLGGLVDDVFSIF